MDWSKQHLPQKNNVFLLDVKAITVCRTLAFHFENSFKWNITKLNNLLHKIRNEPFHKCAKTVVFKEFK